MIQATTILTCADGQTLQPGEIARGIRMGLRLPMPAQKFVERVNMLSGRPAGAIEWR